jgi:hypothetical protein
LCSCVEETNCGEFDVYVSTFNVLFRKPDAMFKIRKVESRSASDHVHLIKVRARSVS